MNNKILIVEDQFIEANSLRISLQKAGYAVCEIASTVEEAIKIKNKEKPNLVLLDIRLQGKLSGIDLARILRSENIAFIFISANSSKEILDAAKTTRPYGFIVKPFRDKDVLVAIEVALYLHQQNQEVISKDQFSTNEIPGDGLTGIIGESPAMAAVLNNIKTVSNSSISVLILGESGTGKELVARCIHRISQRRDKPYIVVNCATLPANLVESELFGHEKGAFTGAQEKRTGKFEQANEGTVFLDEIGELPQDLQIKLLRVLQEKEIDVIGGKKKAIDVRIIAATNRNLEEEVAAGRFRLDLFYRLYVFPVHLPPLRERKEDLLLLANHFLRIYSQKEKKAVTRLSAGALDAMLNYSWPGNIRELENIIARSVLLAKGDTVTDLQLLSFQQKSAPVLSAAAPKTMEENEREYIISIINQCNGKLQGLNGAAKMMNINVSTLRSRMKKLGISKTKYS
ncbi:sigma-54-dependent transcriptional regulator [Mucilaginibacter celer]|uniref:Response regulator n=1 Tax=Mucilaginibacter celer TaxID=2305508 RepID=A0A494VZK5_9SPHI|nr:sigma-54 dependent transcriptional regulator [Mucilaginibacter celer]AYL96933.1 response regulator [Mucilaginibacter celer]